MHVGAAAGAFKKTGNEYFISFKDNAADRANALAIAAYTIEAAAYMHETVLAAVQGRESHGADQFPIIKFGGAYGACLGITRHAYAVGLPFPAAPQKAGVCPGRNTHADEKRISEPEQNNSDYNKNQHFNNTFHYLFPPRRFVCLSL